MNEITSYIEIVPKQLLFMKLIPGNATDAVMRMTAG